jgi:hypothetical protein
MIHVAAGHILVPSYSIACSFSTAVILLRLPRQPPPTVAPSLPLSLNSPSRCPRHPLYPPSSCHRWLGGVNTASLMGRDCRHQSPRPLATNGSMVSTPPHRWVTTATTGAPFYGRREDEALTTPNPSSEHAHHPSSLPPMSVLTIVPRHKSHHWTHPPIIAEPHEGGAVHYLFRTTVRSKDSSLPKA